MCGDEMAGQWTPRGRRAIALENSNDCEKLYSAKQDLFLKGPSHQIRSSENSIHR
jgi:hypothetical protein